MKTTILTATLFLACMAAFSQTKVKVDAKGNYIAVHSPVDTLKANGKTFTDAKGNVYPVMVSVNGKEYYLKTAVKSGNVYKVYIKVK